MNSMDRIHAEIEKIKEMYASLRNVDDYKLFTVVCLKVYYFADNDDYNYETLYNYVIDGANDGGIDAIINDADNNMVIVQSKYYNTSKFDKEIVRNGTYKIEETLNKLRNNTVEGLSDKLKALYHKCKNDMDDDGLIKVVYFTSKNLRPKSKDNIDTYIKETEFEYDVELACQKDIEAQIKFCYESNPFVDRGELVLDRENNKLEYEDSVIVNVSAKSLQDLYCEKNRALLGINLRYYVRMKAVDTGIKNTMKNHPELFWYCNNGIIIICDSYEIQGKRLILKDFSIINGGQTTYNIGNSDIEKDFFITCKLVKAKGDTEDDKIQYSQEIAKASNAQKPIKEADLIANSAEQIQLKRALKNRNIIYCNKRGEVVKPEFKKYPFITCKIEDYGKTALATMFILPGSAKSKKNDMYAEKRHPIIFNSEKSPGIVGDGLIINYFYDQFIKKLKAKLKEGQYSKLDKEELIGLSTEQWEMAKIGGRMVESSMALLCKFANKEFTLSDIEKNRDNLELILSSCEKTKRLLRNPENVKAEELEYIFVYLIKKINRYWNRYADTYTAANFSKNNNCFFKIVYDIIDDYKEGDSFKEKFNKVMMVPLKK